MSFYDLLATGSIAEACAKGGACIEGKDYVMHDGDAAEFRFEVLRRARDPTPATFVPCSR